MRDIEARKEAEWETICHSTMWWDRLPSLVVCCLADGDRLLGITEVWTHLSRLHIHTHIDTSLCLSSWLSFYGNRSQRFNENTVFLCKIKTYFFMFNDSTPILWATQKLFLKKIVLKHFQLFFFVFGIISLSIKHLVPMKSEWNMIDSRLWSWLGSTSSWSRIHQH